MNFREPAFIPEVNHLRDRGSGNKWKCIRCLTAVLLFPVFVAAQSRPSANVSSNNKPFTEGAAALQRGDLSDARASFEEAVRLNPRNPQSRNALGLVLLAQNEPAAAIAQLETAIRLKPS